MKKFILFSMGLTISVSAWTQTPRVDSVAVMILNHMADVIGDMNSCSFKVASSNDVKDFDFGTIKNVGTHEVVMVGPDKMLVLSNGDKGHNGYWYNGEQLTYYSFSENNYAVLDAPADIVSTIDTISKDYGIDFPAADFFYPTFTDDLLAEFPSIRFVGMSKVGGKECFNLIASNAQQNVQFWIANDAYYLPLKYVITYKNHENMQYGASFTDWVVNPDVPEAVFNFNPPPMANRIKMQPMTQK